MNDSIWGDFRDNMEKQNSELCGALVYFLETCIADNERRIAAIKRLRQTRSQEDLREALTSDPISGEQFCAIKSYFSDSSLLENRTLIQRLIEEVVTNGCGYDSRLDISSMQIRFNHSPEELYND